MRRSGMCVAFWVCGMVALVQGDEGPPDPISLDRQSPSIVDFFPGPIPGVPGVGYHTPGNIYDMLPTGPMPPAPPMGLDAGITPGPVVHVLDMNYGLLNQPGSEDNNDAHSNGEQFDFNPDDPFEPNFPGALQILYFSADDLSQGLPGTDYQNQWQLQQAAGDRFMANGITTLSPQQSLAMGQPAKINGPIFPGGALNFPLNLLSANQHRYNEIPSIGPAMPNNYAPRTPQATMADDMDALELTPFDRNGDLVHEMPIYFSLDPGSPSLQVLPGYSAADVLISPPTVMNFTLFSPAASMGLNVQGLGDDVDALAVWDYGQLGFADPGLDWALFSLAPGSIFLSGQDTMPGTPDDYSAADVFVTTFAGANQLYLAANTLGLRFEDNLDALDVEPEWLMQEQLDSVAPPIVLADANGDGRVTGEDFLAWQRGFGKLGPGLTVADGDFNQDDVVVDGMDLAVWQAQYGLYPAAVFTAAVPEPTGSWGVLLVLGCIAWCRRTHV